MPPVRGAADGREFPTETGREYSAGISRSLHRSYLVRRTMVPTGIRTVFRTHRRTVVASWPIAVGQPFRLHCRRYDRRAGRGRISQGHLLDSAADMGPLAAVERFLERLFEGQSARLFHTRLRPIQVQRRLERAMESNRAREDHRTIVPHRLVVRLAPQDLTALRAASPTLAADLADAALAFARAHGFTLLDRPTVTLRGDSDVEPGEV